jgi:hypothetical protein
LLVKQALYVADKLPKHYIYSPSQAKFLELNNCYRVRLPPEFPYFSFSHRSPPLAGRRDKPHMQQPMACLTRGRTLLKVLDVPQ